MDSSGGQRFLVERILNHRDVNGVRTSYLVRWRGYPPAWDSWEPLAQLIVNVLGPVEQYDETHPLRLKKGRRKNTSPEREYRDCKVSIPSAISEEICIKFGEPGLTANALDVADEGIPSLHQGFAVSYTATIVPPMFEERIGEELFLSTDSFRAGIRWANLSATEQRDSIPFGGHAGHSIRLSGWRHPRRLHLGSVAQDISVPGLLIGSSMSTSTCVTPIP
uniref:Chromo domain-containing protein n=1 Tax=Peronospora matthiolae TaxID=2874970 RepID=A0AAV1TS06_9STRA